jgi:hypothetical protein
MISLNVAEILELCVGVGDIRLGGAKEVLRGQDDVYSLAWRSEFKPDIEDKTTGIIL